MFTRLVIGPLLGSSVMLTQAAAQQPHQFHAPAARPAPAAVPHFSAPRPAPPRFSAPPHFSAPPRVSAPPHISAPRITAPPRFNPPPHVAAPHTPPRVNVPRQPPQLAAPHVPPGRPSATPGGRPRLPNAPETGALTRLQSRQLRHEESAQVRQLQTQHRQELRDLRTQKHLDGNSLRELRAHNAQQIRDLHQQFRDRRIGLQRPPAQAGALRPDGRRRVTPQAAREAHFASRFHDDHPARWRADRMSPQLAWRRHHRAAFVAWRGPVFWPYAYTDAFYYPFWPDAYDDGYWPYLYDDFLDSVYWANGNPYSQYPYAAPTAVSAVAEPAAASGNDCGAGGDLAAWPFEKIAKVLGPTTEQQAYLDELKAVAAQAADALKASCPQAAALTPTGRLEAMLVRLQATAGAVHALRAPLLKFYHSLTDEQKARFNAIGPDAGAKTSRASTTHVADTCSGQKAGLTDVPIEGIEDAVRPTDTQQALIDELRKANERAVADLQAACPDSVPQTPVGRLDAIEKRLDAMIEAAKAIQPALQQFYASLTDEQKSRFNTLGQQTGG